MVIMATGLVTLSALVATTVSTMAWFSHLNPSLTGGVESGTTDINATGVKTYKFSSQDGADYEAMHDYSEATDNFDQDTISYTLDAPSSAGYYLLGDSTWALTNGKTSADEWKYAGGQRMTDSGGKNKAYLDGIDLYNNEELRVKKYSFANSSTVNDWVTVTIDSSYSSLATIAGNNIQIHQDGNYDIILNSDTNKIALVRNGNASASKPSLVEEVALEEEPAAIQKSGNSVGKMPGQGPKRSTTVDGASYSSQYIYLYLGGVGDDGNNWSSSDAKIFAHIWDDSSHTADVSVTWLSGSGRYAVWRTSISSITSWTPTKIEFVRTSSSGTISNMYNDGIKWNAAQCNFNLSNNQYKLTGWGSVQADTIKDEAASVSTTTAFYYYKDGSATEITTGTSYSLSFAEDATFKVYRNVKKRLFSFGDPYSDVDTWFDPGSHTSASPSSGMVTAQTTGTKDIVANRAFNANFSFSFTNDSTYTYTFTEKTTVTLNNQSATTAGAGSVTAVYGSNMPSIAANLPAKTGYTFGGYWSETGGSGTQYYKADGTSNRTWNLTGTTQTLYAKWTANTYTVAYNANKPAGATGSVTGVPSDDTWTYDSNATLGSAPSLIGWTFGGWYKEAGCSTKAGDAGDTLTKPNYATGGTVNLYAKWTAKTYTVAYNASKPAGATGSVTGVPSDATWTYDSNATLGSAPSLTGWTFGGWYKEAGCTNKSGDAGDTLTKPNYATSGTYNLYAKWTAKTTTVTLNKQSGTGGSDSVTATYDSAMPSASMPTRSGYTFAGYFTETEGSGTKYYNGDGSSAKKWDITDATKTLYAYWIECYSVAFNGDGSDGGSAPEDNPVYVAVGGNVTMPAMSYTKTGYHIVSDEEWTDGTNTYQAGETYALELGSGESIDIYPKWVANTYSVVYNANKPVGATASVTGVPSSQTWTYDSNATLGSAPSLTGWTFGGWYKDDACTQSAGAAGATLTTPNYATSGTVNLYAKWTAKTTTVTLDMQSGLNGSSPVTATYDSAMPSATMPTRTGYTFGGYFTETNGSGTKYYNADGSSAKKWDITDATKTLYAKWTINSHAVTISAGSGVTGVYLSTANNTGSASGDSSGTSYNYNTTVYAYATLRAGWAKQDGWVQIGETNDYRVGTYNLGDAAYNFGSISAKAVSYTITYNVNGGTSISNTSYTISASDGTKTLATPTRTGYNFGGWSVTSGPTSGTASVTSSTTLNLSANAYGAITVRASWTAKTTTVSFSLNSGSGTVPSAVTATYDSNMPTPLNQAAPTRSGYTFGGWYDTSASSGGTQYYTAQLGSARTWNKTDSTYTLYARWIANDYTVSFDFESGSGGSSSVTAKFGAAMPSITLPTRTNYTFAGYYASSGGSGTKYYNADGSSAHVWDQANSTTTLHAHWTKTSGYYLMGTGLSRDGSSYTTSWDFDEAIAADASTYDSSNNQASWRNDLVVYIGLSASYGTGNDQGFKAIYVNSSEEIVYMDGKVNSGSTSWFNGMQGANNNARCISAGTFYVYFNNDYELCFTKKVVITLDENGGTAGSVTSLQLDSGDAFTPLAGSSELPTPASSDYLFGGYWTKNNGNFVTQYYYPDGTVKTSDTASNSLTLYARYYAKADYFYTGEVYCFVPGDWGEDTNDYYAWPCNGPSADYGFGSKMVASYGAYTYTVPAGIYTNIVFVAVTKNATPNPSNWANVIGKSPDTVKTGAAWSAFNGGHTYRVTSATAGSGTASTGEYVKEFISDEDVYLDANTFGAPASDIYAMWLFGGTASKFVQLSRVDSTTYFTGNTGTGTWAGVIFVRWTSANAPDFVSGTDEANWNKKAEQTANLFRAAGSLICYTYSSGEWSNITNRGTGWYLIGTGASYDSATWVIDWRMDTDNPYDTTREMIASESPTGTDLAKWTTITFAANDEFKIVHVQGVVPNIWIGSDHETHYISSGFITSSSGNIKAIRAFTANIYLNNSSQIIIHIISYADAATGKGYSGASSSADASGDKASFDVTVNLTNFTNPTIDSITPPTGATAATNFEFHHYATAIAKEGNAALGMNVASGVPANLYAIYWRETVVVTVKGATTVDIGDLGVPQTLDKGSTLPTYTYGEGIYGVVLGSAWNVYDQDSNHYLYSSVANVGTGTRYNSAISANMTLYLKFTQRTNSTYYVEDSPASRLAIGVNSYELYAYLFVSGYAMPNPCDLVLHHEFANYYSFSAPSSASVIINNGGNAYKDWDAINGNPSNSRVKTTALSDVVAENHNMMSILASTVLDDTYTVRNVAIALDYSGPLTSPTGSGKDYYLVGAGFTGTTAAADQWKLSTGYKLTSSALAANEYNFNLAEVANFSLTAGTSVFRIVWLDGNPSLASSSVHWLSITLSTVDGTNSRLGGGGVSNITTTTGDAYNLYLYADNSSSYYLSAVPYGGYTGTLTVGENDPVSMGVGDGDDYLIYEAGVDVEEGASFTVSYSYRGGAATPVNAVNSGSTAYISVTSNTFTFLEGGTFAFYVVNEGGNMTLAVAPIPVKGAGYYIQLEQGTSPKYFNYNEATKMNRLKDGSGNYISDSANTNAARYFGFYATAGTKLRLVSYLDGVQRIYDLADSWWTDGDPAQPEDHTDDIYTNAPTSVGTNVITINEDGYYSFYIKTGKVYATSTRGSEIDSEFKNLNQINAAANGSSQADVKQYKTSMVLAISFEVTAAKPVTFGVSLNATSAIRDYICFTVSTIDAELGVYTNPLDYMRDSARYDSGTWYNGTATYTTGSTSFAADTTYVVYIMIDYRYDKLTTAPQLKDSNGFTISLTLTQVSPS